MLVVNGRPAGEFDPKVKQMDRKGKPSFLCPRDSNPDDAQLSAEQMRDVTGKQGGRHVGLSKAYLLLEAGVYEWPP